MDEGDLIEYTREYWNKENDKYQILRDYYIGCGLGINGGKTSLLDAEIEYAKKRLRNEFPHNRKFNNLVFLVGYSLEPLFQLIKIYEPCRIYLLLSNEYFDESGSDRGQNIADLIQENPAFPSVTKVYNNFDIKILGANNGNTVLPDASDPAGVFRISQSFYQHSLAEDSGNKDSNKCELEQNKKAEPFLIDITGSKKSMIAGAYLFGAFTRTPISYVDFDEPYDTYRGRPYGFQCRPSLLSNPYTFFKLGDWEQIRKTYKDHFFKTCSETLASIIPALKSILPEREINGLQHLKDLMDVYDKWDNNLYKDAFDYLKTDKFKPLLNNGFCSPVAVRILGKDWPKQGKDAIDDYKKLEKRNLYCHSQFIQIYAEDEYRRIRRLIEKNHDYRSALLRAAGLNEFLMKARVIRWLAICDDQEYLNGCRIWIDPNEVTGDDKIKLRARIMEGVTKRATAGFFNDLLNGGKVELKYWKFWMQLEPQKLEEILRYATWNKVEKHKNVPINSNQLAELRNKTIHAALPVDEFRAIQALKLVKMNLDNYNEWLMRTLNDDGRTNGEEPQWGIHTWEELVKICGLPSYYSLMGKEDEGGEIHISC